MPKEEIVKTLCLFIGLGIVTGCDGMLEGGIASPDQIFSGAKDCAWLLDRCNAGKPSSCDHYQSRCQTAQDAGPGEPDTAEPAADGTVTPAPDSTVTPAPDSTVTPEPDGQVAQDSGAGTGFTTEGEEHAAIAWDGIAGDPSQGITAWGRLASCSRVGEPTNCSGFDRLSVVDHPQRGKVYQAAMTSGDVYRDKARAELANPLLDDGSAFYIYHGDEYYIGYRGMLSVGFDSEGNGDANSGNIMQLKGKLSCGGPALGLTIKDGRLTLRRETGDAADIDLDAQSLGNREGVFWTGPLVKDLEGQWFELVMHINFNIDPSIGFVEIWLDGVQQSNNGKMKIYGKTMCFDASGERVELKLGIYRNARYNKSTFDYHWINDPRIGSSYDAVTPR